MQRLVISVNKTTPKVFCRDKDSVYDVYKENKLSESQIISVITKPVKSSNPIPIHGKTIFVIKDAMLRGSRRLKGRAINVRIANIVSASSRKV
jgi:hypothetical protein